MESVIDKISEKIHSHDSSSSSSSDSDSDSEKKEAPDSSASVKDKMFRLFGRERLVHHVLVEAKTVDVLLWRNKKSTGAILGAANPWRELNY
ncbi:Reticulon-like protein B5 [Linum grandiflorum]